LDFTVIFELFEKFSHKRHEKIKIMKKKEEVLSVYLKVGIIQKYVRIF